MGKTLVRDIRSVTVGTSSTLLLPERTGRFLTVIGAPPPPVAPVNVATTVGRNLPLNPAGNLLAYTTPAGATGIITGWSWASASATAVVAIGIIRGGIRYNVDQGPPNVFRSIYLPLASADSAQVVCTTAGGVGDLADVTISATSYNTVPRISLGMGSAAVLDAGITIYAGQLPLILPGPALDSEIYGIADAAGRLVNVIDLFYP